MSTSAKPAALSVPPARLPWASPCAPAFHADTRERTRQLLALLKDLLEAGISATRTSHRDHIEPGGQIDEPQRLPQESLRTVAPHRVAHTTGREHSDPGRTKVIAAFPHVERQQPTTALPATAQGRGDVLTPPQSLVGMRRDVHADSFARPRRRRPLTMRRPALVCIRERKPCLRERRRLLGW